MHSMALVRELLELANNRLVSCVIACDFHSTMPEHLNEAIEWVGPDKLMFATDYPHCDFDDPRCIFKVPVRASVKPIIYRNNALVLSELA